MENQVRHTASRFLPSSLTTCRSRNISDVIESSIVLTRNTKNLHEHHLVSPKIQIYPPFTKPKNPNDLTITKELMEVSKPKTQFFDCNAERRKSFPPVKPFSPLKYRHKEISGKETKIKKSSSSNSGWFSSEDEAEDDGGKTDTFFSLSSGSFESLRRKRNDSRRRRGEYDISEMGRSALEVPPSSTDTLLELSPKTATISRNTTKPSLRAEMCHHPSVKERKSDKDISYVLADSSDSATSHPKTTNNHHKTSKTSRETCTNRRRPTKGHTHLAAENEAQDSSVAPLSSTDLYYSHFGKTTNTRRKTNKIRRRRGADLGSIMEGFSFLADDRVEESYAVEKSSSDPYSDFRTSMVEMIVEKQIFGAEDLERLLLRFLSLNSSSYHEIIVQVFSEICETLFSC
ncbi:unnamed protein product [Ilex paraguariensis]|uniref:Transcription repressor n=2 Tax=Ilex paraguariensis TaxID=185542 RepID=A0ABC8UBT2_9AQUA